MMATHNPESAPIRGFLHKIVVNAGIGRLSQQPNFEEKGLKQIMDDLSIITGQRPEVRRAKKSVAGFKVREGQIVGLRVTLRRGRMVDFLRRLITIVLPRVRDFSGLDLKSIDQKGVLNVGLKEQFVFPEVAADRSPLTFTLGVNIVPRKRDREAALATYRRLGIPLKK